MMDNKSRYSFMFGNLETKVVLDIESNWSGAYNMLPALVNSNLSLKRLVIKLAWSLCYVVQRRKQDLNTFLCFYRMKQDNGFEVNEASN